MKRNQETKLLRRLRRVERKCDRILAELLVMRQKRPLADTLDSLIDGLHDSAKRMRMQSDMERDIIMSLIAGGGKP